MGGTGLEDRGRGSRDATPNRKKVGKVLLVLFLGTPILKTNIVEYIPD